MASHILELQLRGDRTAPSEARRALSECDPELLPASLRSDVVLLLSELVSNAIKHARLMGGRVRIALARRDSILRVEVEDPGPCFDPAQAKPEEPGETDGGIGLVVVDRLADRWGVEMREGRCLVWAELVTQ